MVNLNRLAVTVAPLSPRYSFRCPRQYRCSGEGLRITESSRYLQ